jgi:hypothetical protein
MKKHVLKFIATYDDCAIGFYKKKNKKKNVRRKKLVMFMIKDYFSSIIKKAFCMKNSIIEVNNRMKTRLYK